MKFSRETTRLQLSELPNDRRRCIALAAAHRMSHVYDSWAIPEFAVAQRLCQRLWGVIITKNAGWPKPFSKEDLKPLYPRSEVEFHPLAAVAEDCISALEYALDAHLTGSVQSAAFSLERAYEAAYQVPSHS